MRSHPPCPQKPSHPCPQVWGREGLCSLASHTWARPTWAWIHPQRLRVGRPAGVDPEVSQAPGPASNSISEGQRQGWSTRCLLQLCLGARWMGKGLELAKKLRGTRSANQPEQGTLCPPSLSAFQAQSALCSLGPATAVSSRGKSPRAFLGTSQVPLAIAHGLMPRREECTHLGPRGAVLIPPGSADPGIRPGCARCEQRHLNHPGQERGEEEADGPQQADDDEHPEEDPVYDHGDVFPVLLHLRADGNQGG